MAGQPPEHDNRIDILARERCFDGFLKVDRLRLRHRLFDGGWSDPMHREVVLRRPAAAVLPYDVGRDRVVLIEQFRVGALAAGLEPWTIEAVAGIVEDGEDEVTVCRREALEEAGVTLGAVHRVARFLPSGGGLSEIVSVYVGLCDSTAVGGTHGVASEHEDIRAFALPFDDAFAMIADGRMVAAHGVVALQWIALNRHGLRHGDVMG